MSSASVTTNFVNGTVIDADVVDQNFTDLVNFANSHLVHNHDASVIRHGVRLHKTASSVATGSATSITWGDEGQDTDGYWSAGTTVTIPAGMAGVYAITFSTAGLISAGRAFVQLNMTVSLSNSPSDFRVIMDPGEDRGVVTATLPLAVGDSFTCDVFHSTGSTVTFESWLSAYRISP